MHHAPRTSRATRALALLALLALPAACADREPAPGTDSVLAEDLALAQSVNPTPVFQDTALTAPVTPRRDAPPATAPRAAERPRSTPRPSPVRETPAPVTPEPTPEPAIEAPAPAPVARGIAAGTGMRFATGDRVCTNAGRPGDKVVATLGETVRGTDGTVIPAGTKAVLEIAEMTRGERPEDTRITFRVRAILVDGASLPVAAEVAVLDSLERVRAEQKGSDAKKVVGGAVLGAIAGQILGKDTKATVIGAAAGAAAGTAVAVKTAVYDGCLPAGADVRVTLTERLVVASGGM
ncbi:MAG TPA: hypothetical protein VFZ11_07805 [Gemmatimonadaceae bacterium]